MSQEKKAMREKFRNECFERDGHCVCCTEKNIINTHHIRNRNEFKNGGYVKENGATLCLDHHILAEQGFVSARELYKIINSSFEKAQRKDNERN